MNWLPSNANGALRRNRRVAMFWSRGSFAAPSSTVTTGSITLAATASATGGAYIGCVIQILSGTGAGQTALTTELTTQYNPDNTRATGTLTEGATANIFKTVGTNTLDAGATIEEHGILNQAATGGGVLLDRSLTGTKTLASGEGLQSTYELSIASGG